MFKPDMWWTRPVLNFSGLICPDIAAIARSTAQNKIAVL
jgi:hypothetical protein